MSHSALANELRTQAPVATHELNVTPMLDVLLVLLVIFMSAAVGMHRTIDASLPEVCPGTCVNGGQTIVLEVLPGARFLVNKTEVPARELSQRLRAIYASRPDKILQVAGYPGVRYEEVISAMDIARSAGVRVIGIPPTESYLER